MTIGERVLSLLKESGKKQKELAEFIGAGTSTISQWKDGNRNPSSELLIPICEFLGVSVEYILTGNDQEYPRLSQADQELIHWLHLLNEETQRDFLGTIRLYAKQHPEDLLDGEFVSDAQKSQEGRMISSK